MRLRFVVAASLLVAACGADDAAAPVVDRPAPALVATTPPSAPPASADAGIRRWDPPAFDPLTRCEPLHDATAPHGAASPTKEPVVTARFSAEQPGDARIELMIGGVVYALREGAGGPEILDGGSVVGAGVGIPSAPGDWTLRFLDEGKVLRAKAWPTAMHEPSAWQASYVLPTTDADESGVTRIHFTGASDRYVLAGVAVGAHLASPNFHDYVSCAMSMPTIGPPADGTTDDGGDMANQVEVGSLMKWAIDPTVPRLVVASAGTSSIVDANNVVTCPTGRCLTTRFTTNDLAYAALKAAGYTDDDIANPAKIRFVMWGYGDYARDHDLTFFATGLGDARPLTIRDLGGANSAMLGPDAAPSANLLPWVGTFAYTQEHLLDDAQRMRDAVNAYAKTAPEFAAHTLVIGHSWGAATATALMLREDLEFHVDLGLSAAMPKFVAGIDQLGTCASNLFFGGCDGIIPALDLDQGFYLGPAGLPLYRIDRPDDPVAQARNVSGLITTLQDTGGQGSLGGHDYDIRRSAAKTPATCTRSYQSCTAGVFCSTEHETVSYLPPPIQTSYVGMYGIDSFHVSCNVESGGTLEYWCNDVAMLSGVDCKTLPTGKLCAAKPTDCP